MSIIGEADHWAFIRFFVDGVVLETNFLKFHALEAFAAISGFTAFLEAEVEVDRIIADASEVFGELIGVEDAAFGAGCIFGSLVITCIEFVGKGIEVGLI